MEIKHVWGKHLPHHTGREKSFIEVTSREIMPDGRLASRRPETYIEKRKQIDPIQTGIVYLNTLCQANKAPTREYLVVQYDAESSPDRSYNLADNNPDKTDPQNAFVACAAMANMFLNKFHREPQKRKRRR